MEPKKEVLSVQTSILLSAVIISVSIIFASSGTSSTGSTVLGDATGEKVEIAERKDAPSQGKGEVTIVEFSDFQCPFCQNFWSTTYKQIKENYIDTGKVKLVYRHFPLSNIHPNAQMAAEAGECANLQGRFWQYHDTLFSKGKSDGTGLDTLSLKQYAVSLGLDTAQFNSCLDNHDTADTVAKDLAEGTKAGITGTPTFFVNGVAVVGAQPYSAFEQIIKEALK